MLRISHHTNASNAFNAFEHFFGPAFMAQLQAPTPSSLRRAHQTRGIQAELRHAKDGWQLRAELPGVDPEAVDIQVAEHELSLAVRSSGPAPEGMEAVFTERPNGEFERRWRVRESIDTEAVDVEFTDGFLTVHLKPRKQNAPRKIELPIKKTRDADS